MRLFAKRHSVCAVCQVHFEPAPYEPHPELCLTHRRPVMKRENRIKAVMKWAEANWTKLEPQALEELSAGYNARRAASERYADPFVGL